MHSIFEQRLENNQPLIIRAPKTSDAQAMCDYINALSKEQTFIRFQGEQVTSEYETEYLEKQLKKIEEKKAVMLLTATNLAKNHLDGLRIIELSVFATNCLAVKLYEKFGFKEYGRLQEGVARQDKYEDHVFMFLKVK
ncbi:MAG: hypothetical protein COY80_04610 [Candidatus Pacebacteria bacterium CG_4_10_14_0_8_um_filter_42_14]|nr:MAG: hypothetical protein COY80_04610 [Candidatus Pacebacteria bacterium CG_4_10_14_0_8_um_filter_42_14]